MTPTQMIRSWFAVTVAGLHIGDDRITLVVIRTVGKKWHLVSLDREQRLLCEPDYPASAVERLTGRVVPGSPFVFTNVASCEITYRVEVRDVRTGSGFNRSDTRDSNAAESTENLTRRKSRQLNRFETLICEATTPKSSVDTVKNMLSTVGFEVCGVGFDLAAPGILGRVFQKKDSRSDWSVAVSANPEGTLVLDFTSGLLRKIRSSAHTDYPEKVSKALEDADGRPVDDLQCVPPDALLALCLALAGAVGGRDPIDFLEIEEKRNWIAYRERQQTRRMVLRVAIILALVMGTVPVVEEILEVHMPNYSEASQISALSADTVARAIRSQNRLLEKWKMIRRLEQNRTTVGKTLASLSGVQSDQLWFTSLSAITDSSRIGMTIEGRATHEVVLADYLRRLDTASSGWRISLRKEELVERALSDRLSPEDSISVRFTLQVDSYETAPDHE